MWKSRKLKIFEKEERCQECNEYYCLNEKNGFYYDNDLMEMKMIIFILLGLDYTNKNGTSCGKNV